MTRTILNANGVIADFPADNNNSASFIMLFSKWEN